jgi:hypothetical protein
MACSVSVFAFATHARNDWPTKGASSIAPS